MRRREFIVGLGSAATWPVAARAQQGDRIRRIGLFGVGNQDDPAIKAMVSAFTRGLAEFGWTDGRNVRMDVRWSAVDADRTRVFAKELVDLQPEVILVDSTPATAILQQETRTIPTVFVEVSDPVGSGFVASVPRPGGNITGFINQDASMGGKWLQLLTEIAPSLNRVAMMFNPDTAPYVRSYYLPSLEAAARSLKVQSFAALVNSDAEIETVITSLGRDPVAALIIPPDVFMFGHRTPIILLAAQNNVPVVSFNFVFTREGGLLSYGADQEDLFRRAAAYVDRILRGEKPADLPVQLPIKFLMAINLKTAKALGLTVPQSTLLLADEVIE